MERVAVLVSKWTGHARARTLPPRAASGTAEVKRLFEAYVVSAAPPMITSDLRIGFRSVVFSAGIVPYLFCYSAQNCSSWAIST
jgi:hypothetical protein